MQRLMLCLLATLVSVAQVAAAENTPRLLLAENGKARCCVVVSNDEKFIEPDAFNWSPKTPFLKWAADDLAQYLGRMSGTEIPISDAPVDGLIPIYVGRTEDKWNHPTPYGDTYVLDVTPERIVLAGQSRRAVYYAASQLLGDLGVRWYAPGAIGEVVPERQMVDIEIGRREFAPDFMTRRLWCRPGDELRWMYRNRLGDATIPCGHAMHTFGASLPGWKERQAEQHADFYSVVNGQAGYFPNMANPRVVEIFAKRAIELLDRSSHSGQSGKQARGFITISPDDGYLRDDRPEVVAMNSPGREPILGMPSFSDAWITFLNNICAEIERQSPGLEFKLGTLAYMNYIQPPRKVKPDARVVPVIAPISFNRYVSMGTPDAPTSQMLAELFKGWTAVSPRVGTYFYNFNLADMAMPYTRRVIWTRNIPLLHEWGVRDFTAESHPNWHTMMPGNYVAARLLWDTKTDVNALLDEYYPAYYGPAAAAMRAYDTTLEEAYESTKVFAGGVWGMHRILTPQVMKQLEASLIDAENASRGKGVFEQRVEIVRFSLTFAKTYFAARDALNRCDLMEAQKQGEAFIANYRAGFDKYPVFFGKNVSWSPNIERYFELFHHRTLKDAGRVAREGKVILTLPDELDAHLEPAEGGSKPSGKMPDDGAKWEPLKTYSATLDEQGHPFFRGVIWYRHSFAPLPAVDGTKKVMLWFGGLDSRVRVWLNHQDLGEKYVGSFGCWEVDITNAVHASKSNELLISVDNTFPNEIGTGGIVRPVLIYTTPK